MRLCVGALKEFLNKVGGPLQRPTDHAWANGQGDASPPPPARSCGGAPSLGGALQIAHSVHNQVYRQGWSGT